MEYISKPESAETEFKECGKGHLPDDLWETISAFSNSHGGVIFLGVKNDGKIMKLDDEKIDSLQKEASSLINNNKFNNKPKVNMLVEHKMVKVVVAEAEFYNKPIYSKKAGPKCIWIRQGSTNVRATDEEMRSLFAGLTGGGENQPITGNIADLIDSEKVDKYISKTGLKTLRLGTLDEKLDKIKAVRGSKLNIFGLITLGKNEVIDEKLNNVYIDFRIFPGPSKINPGSEEIIYLDRKEFHGDIRTQFVKAFNYIKSKLPTIAVLNKETGLRENKPIISEDAIREALANALAHRDYLIQSSSINIDLYSDRIEFTNPGESLVAIRDIKRASSKSRNPNLMEFLKTFNITDKTARGIPTICQAAQARGLLEPKFENISGLFRATLYFSSPYTDKDKKWVDNLCSQFSLKNTQKNALIFIRNNGAITNRQFCELNHMTQRNDDRKARRELSKLQELGLIKQTGAGPGTKYILYE